MLPPVSLPHLSFGAPPQPGPPLCYLKSTKQLLLGALYPGAEGVMGQVLIRPTWVLAGKGIGVTLTPSTSSPSSGLWPFHTG